VEDKKKNKTKKDWARAAMRSSQFADHQILGMIFFSLSLSYLLGSLISLSSISSFLSLLFYLSSISSLVLYFSLLSLFPLPTWFDGAH